MSGMRGIGGEQERASEGIEVMRMKRGAWSFDSMLLL